MCQQTDGLDVSWDSDVNKKPVIYAAHTTLGVRNIPLTGCVRAPGFISFFEVRTHKHNAVIPVNGNL